MSGGTKSEAPPADLGDSGRGCVGGGGGVGLGKERVL